MSGKLWIPRAERANGPLRTGNSMVGGPPRVVHHITWDRLDPRPSYDGVRNYLVTAGFEPTLMVDPISGRMTQFLPASRAAYALRNASGGVQTNRMGTACIQVEWFFSPGLTVKGVRYDDLTDTPMRGLDEVLDLAESWGVPLVWPLGEPVWKGARRDARVWAAQAGHYGHCHVPENTHTDPGPLKLRRPLKPVPAVKPTTPAPPPAPQPVPPPVILEEDDMRAQAITADGVAWFAALPDRCWHIRDQDELNAMRAAGTLIEPVRQVTPAQLEVLVRASR